MGWALLPGTYPFCKEVIKSYLRFVRILYKRKKNLISLYMSADIYYIFIVVIRKEVGLLKAQRLVRQLRGDSYSMMGLQTETEYRFKINARKLFDLKTLKLKKLDDDVTLVIGKLKFQNQGPATIIVTEDVSANNLRELAQETDCMIEGD